MSADLIAYYAARRAMLITMGEGRHYDDTVEVDSATRATDLHATAHVRVECWIVSTVGGTDCDGTNYPYWCLIHQDGADTRVVCMSGDC